MHRLLALVVLFAVMAVPAAAADAKAPKKTEPGTSVEMPFLIAPMNQDGKLLGYAYISSKLVCTSMSAVVDVREKMAFIQDAFVRDVNARPISKIDDPTAVDREVLNARLTAAAKRVVGESKVRDMVFVDVQYAPLHPSESTANVASTPAAQPASGTAGGAQPAAGTAPAAGDGKPQTGSGSGAQPAATSKPPVK